LNNEKIYRVLQDILKEKVLLVIGTGSSMSLDQNFGMEKLKQELLSKIPDAISSFENAGKAQWEEVKKRLDNGFILETAMNDIRDKSLLKSIVYITGNLISELDKKYNLSILKQNDILPIEEFLKKLVSGLPESNPVLNIITPNYDMLLEHCCDKLKIPFCTGFVGGIRKYCDWQLSIKSMEITRDLPQRNKIKKVIRTKRHIRLHKVHGSLNWFKLNDSFFQNDSLSYIQQDEFDRMIISPGDKKFEEVLQCSREILSRADEAIRLEKAFVFIGYGFNDIHIDKELKTALITHEKPGIIITKALSDNAQKIVSESKNLWAVFQNNGDPGSTSILHHSFSAPVVFNNLDIWQIDKFSKEILGD